MKKGLKILFEVLLILLGIIVVLVFLAFSAKSEIVPDIYVTSESGKVALAVMGNYQWNSFSESMVVDSISPQDYVYTSSNVLLVTPGEKMIFQNSDNPLTGYKFYQVSMKYYDSMGMEVVVPTVDNSKAYADLKYLEMDAPSVEGTYVYQFQLSYYNKGEVSYGLKVVVSTEPNYEIQDLIRYKNTSLKDLTSIQEILNLLPYAKYQNGIVVRTNSEFMELRVNYNQLAVDQSALFNNTVALFTLIPELELITYCTEIEELTYTRSEIENQVGRNVSDYANHVELWKSEILFKEPWKDERVTRDEIYKMILSDIISEEILGDNGVIMIDTKSLAENDFLPLSSVDCYEILKYVSDLVPNVYDITLQEYQNIHSHELFVALSSIRDGDSQLESGDYMTSGDLWQSMEARKENEMKLESGESFEQNEMKRWISVVNIWSNGKQKEKEYEIYYADEKWNVIEL